MGESACSPYTCQMLSMVGSLGESRVLLPPQPTSARPGTSVSVASSGALEGLGKGGPSLVISALRYVAVIIPAAFILSRIIGAAGVWHAFWITELITAVVSFYIFVRSKSK